MQRPRLPIEHPNPPRVSIRAGEIRPFGAVDLDRAGDLHDRCATMPRKPPLNIGWWGERKTTYPSMFYIVIVTPRSGAHT
jgi:hypothetical protein